MTEPVQPRPGVLPAIALLAEEERPDGVLWTVRAGSVEIPVRFDGTRMATDGTEVADEAALLFAKLLSAERTLRAYRGTLAGDAGAAVHAALLAARDAAVRALVERGWVPLLDGD